MSNFGLERNDKSIVAINVSIFKSLSWGHPVCRSLIYCDKISSIAVLCFDENNLCIIQ